MAGTKGLSISTSNVLVDLTPTITDSGIDEVPENISDPDHSLNYTCGSSSANFTVSYGAVNNLTYVGVSGHNAATPGNSTVQLFNGGLLIDSVVLVRNNNIMFTFPMMNFSDLRVVFITSPVTYQMTLSFIAAGKHLTILTGEQSGYKRAWLNRPTTQKMTTNLQVAPVSGTKKKVAQKGDLKFPNEAATFSRGDWQDFIDFSYEQPFFIKEQVDLPESSYICFDPTHDTKAHSKTRELDAIMVKFTAFTGL